MYYVCKYVVCLGKYVVCLGPNMYYLGNLQTKKALNLRPKGPSLGIYLGCNFEKKTIVLFEICKNTEPRAKLKIF